MPITMYATFTVILYNSHGVNNYVNFFMTATVHMHNAYMYLHLFSSVRARSTNWINKHVTSFDLWNISNIHLFDPKIILDGVWIVCESTIDNL